MNSYYAIDKWNNKIAYKSANLFQLKAAIASAKRPESDFIITVGVDMKYVSRIVYVDNTCIYNNRAFWLNESASILEDYESHTVLDFMGNPVDQTRFEVERNSNISRLSSIDGVAGEVEYNITVGNEFISLFREECIFTDFQTVTPLDIAQKLLTVISLVQTGSFREAKMVLKGVEPDAFLTAERLKKYEDMLDAADAITYATPEDYFYTASQDE